MGEEGHISLTLATQWHGREGTGQISCCHTHRTVSPVPCQQGQPAVLSELGTESSLLSAAAGKGRDKFSHSYDPGTCFSRLQSMARRGQGAYRSLVHATIGLPLPLSCFQVLLTPTDLSMDNSSALLWGGAGPALPSAALGEGQGQFSLVLQSVRGRANSVHSIFTSFSGIRGHGHHQRPLQVHSYWDGPNDSEAFGPRHGPRFGPSSWAPSLSSDVNRSLRHQCRS